jgi:hypothetical protein
MLSFTTLAWFSRMNMLRWCQGHLKVITPVVIGVSPLETVHSSQHPVGPSNPS